METGDFTAPNTETLDKDEVTPDNHASGRSTPGSESVSDSDSLETVSDTYSSLVAELHKEIDDCSILQKDGLQDFLCSKLKPLLDKFASEMCRVHHLSEQLHLALEITGTSSPEENNPLDRQAKLHVPSLKDTLSKIGLGKDMDNLQNYLISSDRMCLLSDLEALRMELRDCQQRHQVTTQGLQQSLRATEEHYQALVSRLQQGLHSTEKQVHCLHQLLRASEENAEALHRGLCTSQEESQSLRQDLGLSEEDLQALRLELGGYENRVQALRLELQASEENVQLLRKNLCASEELCKSMQEQLQVSEQKAQVLQEAAVVWESQAQSNEDQRQQRERELENQYRQEVRKMARALERSKQRLENHQQQVQKILEEAAQRERALHEALATEQTQNQKEREELQENVDRAKEDKVQVEQLLRGQIIGLKNQLVDELCKANKKMEGWAKYEKELQDTIKNLRQTLRQQTEGRDLALDCLRRRYRDVAMIHRLLEANIQYCGQTQEACPQAGALHEAQSAAGLLPHELRQDLQEVKTHLQSALEKQETEQCEASPGKEKWEEVLRRAEEWQREAERLVTSLDHVDMDSTLKGEQREAHAGMCVQSPTPSVSLLSHSPSVDLQRSPSRAASVEECRPNEEEGQSVSVVQRRLRNLKSVHFQKSLKEFLQVT